MALDMWSRRKFLGIGSALGIAPIARDPSRQLKGWTRFKPQPRQSRASRPMMSRR